jgi:hypothetical protein
MFSISLTSRSRAHVHTNKKTTIMIMKKYFSSLPSKHFASIVRSASIDKKGAK